MILSLNKFFKYFFVLILISGAFGVYASTGNIDANNHGALFCEDDTCTTTSQINSGYFLNTPSSNVSVTDNSLTGYIWGANFGWVVLNCSNTISGCSSTNGNFKVANDGKGNLSGYAWGDNAGWINFGPFNNNSASTVKINSSGEFSGYAWAQNYGWIKFDCGVANACTKTDWRPTNNNGGSGGGGGGGGTTDVCTNISGNQSSVPQGLIKQGGECKTFCEFNPTDSSCVTQTFCELHPSDPSCITQTFCELHPTDSSCSTQTFCELHPTDPSCVTQTFCELHPTDPTCTTQTFCELHPSDPSCITQTFCELHPTDPTCTTQTYCELHPSDPSCVVITQTFCELHPNDSACSTKAYCELHPSDPSCTSSSTTVSTTVKEIVKNVTDSLKNVTDVAQKTKDKVIEIIKTPAGDVASKVVATTGAISGASISIATVLFANPLSFSELFLIPLRLWSLILIAFGLKKRNVPWGTVYDSVTKQPLDPAYVVLQDLNGNEVATSITDLDGRYGFLVPAGQYRMIANKTNYEFPSKKLLGKQRDELYQELYFNEIINVPEGGVITKNIPMDPLKFDWNEFAKKDKSLMKFFSRRDLWIARISEILFFIGLIITIISVAVNPVFYNIAILVVYILLFILKRTILKPRAFGNIKEKDTKNPLSFAIIRVFFAGGDHEVIHKVADKTGKYYCLVPNGKYYTKIESKNLDESYSLVNTSEPMEIKTGHINKKFEV